MADTSTGRGRAVEFRGAGVGMVAAESLLQRRWMRDVTLSARGRKVGIMASSGQPGRALMPILRTAAGVAALMALAAAPAAAQILKCTDASGNVTYQNEPCP